MATYTEHYGLHQWVPEDNFLRSDFNVDLEKIDTALGNMNGIVFGSYTGDDTEDRFIELGFTPKGLYSCTEGGIAGNIDTYQYCYGGLAFSGHPVCFENDVISVESNGFRIRKPNSRVFANQNAVVYYYMAVR